MNTREMLPGLCSRITYDDKKVSLVISFALMFGLFSKPQFAWKTMPNLSKGTRKCFACLFQACSVSIGVLLLSRFQ